MAQGLRKMLDYVQEQLGGGMLAEVGMARLGLLLGKNIVKDIEHAHDDPFLIEKMKSAIEKVLNVKDIDMAKILNHDGTAAPNTAVKDSKVQLFYKVNYNYQNNEALMFGMPMVFHCNHYNVFLQRTIEDAGEHIDSTKILTDAAAEVSFDTLKAYFTANARYAEPASILKIASAIFRVNGYGKAVIKPENLTSARSEISLSHSHYALGWKGKYGTREKPVCFFAAGFFQGAVAYAYGKNSPTDYRAHEKHCAASGEGVCSIIVEEVK